MENKNKSLLSILIHFFASLYDLAIVIFRSLITFLASFYDLVSHFITFLWDYLKWMTTSDTTDFNTPAEEPIKVHNKNPFNI